MRLGVTRQEGFRLSLHPSGEVLVIPAPQEIDPTAEDPPGTQEGPSEGLDPGSEGQGADPAT